MSLVALESIIPEGIDHFLLDGAKLYVHPEDTPATKNILRVLFLEFHSYRFARFRIDEFEGII